MSDVIAIVGPGALGLVLATVLVEGGASVLVLDRDPARAARLSRGGVRVSGPGERPERSVALRVTADPADLRQAAISLVCVKAHADEEAARALGHAPRGAAIVALGNGLGRGEALSSLGRERVLVGTTTEGATLESEGDVRHAARGLTRVAALAGPASAGLAGRVAATLARHGLDAHAADDARQLVWEKVQVNAAINAVAALLDGPNGVLLDSPSARALGQQAAVECGEVPACSACPARGPPMPRGPGGKRSREPRRPIFARPFRTSEGAGSRRSML